MKKAKSKNLELFIFASLLMITIFYLPNVSANWVCGRVNDSADGRSAAWHYVNVYYPQDRNNSALCDISPADNKYCCDTETIPKHSWKTGDTLAADIADFENAYAAGPVSIVTTGQGYDVMPEMQIEPVITIYSPENRIYLNNSVLLNITTLPQYNKIWYILNQSDNITNQGICESCNNASLILENLSYGQYELIIYATSASNQNKIFKRGVSFALLENIGFDREFECKGCRKHSVPSGRNMNVTVMVNLSHEVNNLYLVDYYPIDWTIADSNDGLANQHSETHNKVSWEVSGKEIEVTYAIKSPSLIFPRRYIFQSEIGKQKSSNYSVIVRRFPFFSIAKRYNINPYSTIKKYFKGEPGKPIILYIRNNEPVERIILMPNREVNDIWVNIGRVKASQVKNKPKNIYGYVYIDTNLREEELAYLTIEFRVEKSWLKKHKHKKAVILTYYEGKWIEINTAKENEDNQHVHYKATSQKSGIFAITGVS